MANHFHLLDKTKHNKPFKGGAGTCLSGGGRGEGVQGGRAFTSVVSYSLRRYVGNPTTTSHTLLPLCIETMQATSAAVLTPFSLFSPSSGGETWQAQWLVKGTRPASMLVGETRQEKIEKGERTARASTNMFSNEADVAQRQFVNAV